MNNPNARSYEILQTYLKSGIIDINEVLKDFESMTKKKILKQHKYAIYYSESEKSWRTYLPDETHPRKRRPVKSKSKENLEKKIVNFYIAQNEQKNRNKITLENLYKEWLIYKRDNTPTKAKTIMEYTYEWKLFFEGSDLSQMPVTEIKPITLIRFFRKVTKDRQYTRKRITNARAVLNGILTYAIEEELIQNNPLNGVNFKNFTYKPVENQSNNVFTKEETQKLLSYLKTIEEPYALAIQLSFYLFIRVGETKAIAWDDIDFERRTVYLHGQVLTERTLQDDFTFSKQYTVVVNQMKGNTSRGYRKQYLTDEALIILEKAHCLNPNGHYVFEPNGTVMTTDSFNRRLKKYCKEAGIPYHSSHKIRFYNASTAYDGKNLVTISKLMGHTTVETTMHYLRDVSQDDSINSVFQNLGLNQ